MAHPKRSRLRMTDETLPKTPLDTRTLRKATRLVHGGTMRSSFGETSEALFLTQGYVYETMEAAEARFKGEAPGFMAWAIWPTAFWVRDTAAFEAALMPAVAAASAMA